MCSTISLAEAAEIAQEIGFEGATMTLVEPTAGKETEVTWIDAYMGAIELPGKNMVWQDTLRGLGIRVKAGSVKAPA